jgi:RNA polymerase sigma-70 factor (ECF subfamily)
VSAAIDELWKRGRAAWPGIEVSAPRFRDDVERRLARTGMTDGIDRLHTDIYVAIAAADGDDRAIAACDRIASNEVDFAQGRLRATAAQADDVRGELRRLLFVAEDERPAAITTFTGRGDLRGYARVIVARALVRRIQKDKKEVALEPDAMDALVPTLDPEMQHLREHYREDVDQAFRAALVNLSERERAVLRFHLLDGWSIDQIGERYGVHRATAARWVGAAREKLGEDLRKRLAERLAIPASQVSSIVALVTSAIEVSLDRLLA